MPLPGSAPADRKGLLRGMIRFTFLMMFTSLPLITPFTPNFTT